MILKLVSLRKLMGQLKHKGYTGSVEYSKEDNCLFGRVLGLRKGTTIIELYQKNL